MPTSGPAWPDDIFDAFRRADIRHVAYVPDAGHTRLIERCLSDPDVRAISLTTEEEGVALLAGSWLGGVRGALLMQSSGVGNCINMLSLVDECRLPLLMVVTMRGEWGESNPWQVPMGQSTAAVLRASGVIVQHLTDGAAAGAEAAAAAQLAFLSTRAVALLIGQRLIGAKTFDSRGDAA